MPPAAWLGAFPLLLVTLLLLVQLPVRQQDLLVVSPPPLPLVFPTTMLLP